MKKVVFLCIVIALGYAFFQDWSANNEPVEYMTPEGTAERVAEDIIRDVWGARSRRIGEKEPVTRVKSIKTIPQADGTLALDMRIHIEGANEYGVWNGLLDHVKKLFPKFIAESKLDGYNEFRLYGSLPMQDRNGNISEDNISKVFFTRKAVQEISWDKVDNNDLHFLLMKKNDGKNCTYWIHGGILSQVPHLKYFAK